MSLRLIHASVPASFRAPSELATRSADKSVAPIQSGAHLPGTFPGPSRKLPGTSPEAGPLVFWTPWSAKGWRG